MWILQDSREQNPIEFDLTITKGEGVEKVEVTKLDYGDYMARFGDGHIPPFSFERKSISDLFGTMGKGYSRFKKEILRAQEDKVQLFIIIEGTLTKVLRGYQRSMLEGISVVKKLYTLWLRYRVQPVFVKDRKEMAEYIRQFYLAVGREYIRRRDGN